MEEEEKLTKRERRALAKEEKRKARERGERTNKIRNWVIGLLVMAGLIFAGYRAWVWINTPQPEVGEISNVNDKDWVKGNEEASVTLVEYSDFACPACANYQPILTRLIEELGDDIRLVYRHFPTVSANDPAYPSFRAAEAAGRQGKFWEMHDLLFERQKEWSSDNTPLDKLEGYAEELGLDVESFKSDYESEEIRQRLPTIYFGKPSETTRVFPWQSAHLENRFFREEGLKRLLSKYIIVDGVQSYLVAVTPSEHPRYRKSTWESLEYCKASVIRGGQEHLFQMAAEKLEPNLETFEKFLASIRSKRAK